LLCSFIRQITIYIERYSLALAAKLRWATGKVPYYHSCRIIDHDSKGIGATIGQLPDIGGNSSKLELRLSSVILTKIPLRKDWEVFIQARQGNKLSGKAALIEWA
jgi:hypothetical protein